MTKPSESHDAPRGIGWACSGLLTPRDAANLRRFSAWNISLALTFAGSVLLLAQDMVNPRLGYLLAAVTLGLGIAAVRAYIRFLRGADELLRKIHLEAIAVAFGAGVVSILTWELLELAGAPKLQLSLFAAAMLIFWGIGQAVGIRHYSEGSN
jgi:hypothetical protein